MSTNPAGPAQLYRLNRDHLAAPAILALVGLRAAFLERLTAVLAGWDPAPGYAALFGSASRGDERPDSDLDICVLRPGNVPADAPAWRAQVAALERDATRWTGNDTRVLELSVTDAPAGGRTFRPTRDGIDTSDGARGDAESVIDDVLRDGISLAGDVAALRRLLTPHRRTRELPSPR